MYIHAAPIGFQQAMLYDSAGDSKGFFPCHSPPFQQASSPLHLKTVGSVEFRLEKTATGALLLLTESGFDKIPSNRRLEAFRMNDGGWTEQ